MSFSQTATSRTVLRSEKTLKVWSGLRLSPFALGAAAVPLVSLTETSAGAFGCAASEWDVVPGGLSGGDSAFFLAIALLSLVGVEAEQAHAQPLAQLGLLDVGHPPADAAVL